jgi:transcriptional regulator with XRE-family HTH domain
MIDNKVVLRIGEKIRSVRLQKNLTIQILATRTSLSKGLLSKIENGRTVPSVPVLLTLIDALGVSLKEFFSDMLTTNGRTYLHLKKDEFTRTERGTREGFEYLHVFSHYISDATLNVVLLTIEPLARSIPMTTDGHEFKYVIHGTCDYVINDEIVSLSEGDAIFFDGRLAHTPINNSSSKAVMLVMYLLGDR